MEKGCRSGAAFLFSGLFFCLVKLVQPVNLAVNQVYLAINGSPAKLSLDPTDLLALPGMALAGWIWFHPPKLQPLKRRALGLAIASLALLADAAPPQPMGIICIRNEGQNFVVFEKQLYSGALYYNVFTSADLGQSWTLETKLPKPGSTPTPKQLPYQQVFDGCVDHYENWSIDNPTDPQTKFYFLLSQGVYLSPDNGETLRKQFEIPTGEGVHESVLLPDGTLALAAGKSGIYILPPGGEWLQIPENKITGRGAPETTK